MHLQLNSKTSHSSGGETSYIFLPSEQGDHLISLIEIQQLYETYAKLDTDRVTGIHDRSGMVWVVLPVPAHQLLHQSRLLRHPVPETPKAL